MLLLELRRANATRPVAMLLLPSPLALLLAPVAVLKLPSPSALDAKPVAVLPLALPRAVALNPNAELPDASPSALELNPKAEFTELMPPALALVSQATLPVPPEAVAPAPFCGWTRLCSRRRRTESQPAEQTPSRAWLLPEVGQCGVHKVGFSLEDFHSREGPSEGFALSIFLRGHK